MKKYYNFETSSASLKHDLRILLKMAGIYYEVSDLEDGWHFEIFCDVTENISASCA